MEKKLHRKVWESVNGQIPKDKNGRSFEIHHIDGDYSNNSIENLSCLSIDEHLDVHLKQEDWGAVAAIARRLKVSSEEQYKLNQLAGKDAYKKKLGWFSISKEDKLKSSIAGGKAMKGYRWYNDGINQIRSKTPLESNWKLGRITGRFKFGMKIGTKLGKFWNNGIKNVRSIESPGDGWIQKRLLSAEQRNRRSEIAKLVLKRRWNDNKSL